MESLGANRYSSTLYVVVCVGKLEASTLQHTTVRRYVEFRTQWRTADSYNVSWLGVSTTVARRRLSNTVHSKRCILIPVLYRRCTWNANADTDAHYLSLEMALAV